MNSRTLFVAMLALWLGARERAHAENEPEESGERTVEEASPPAKVHSVAASLASSSNPLDLSTRGFPDFRLPRGADGGLEQPDRVYTAFGIGMFVASGAELASTELGLGRPGIYESNPLQRNRTCAF